MPRRRPTSSATRSSSGRPSPWAAPAPGIAYDEAELRRIAGAGLHASPTTEVLLEESILGWKEYELELMRDRHDNVVVVCSIENLDPMGVHTGDSITVAPAMTLTDREYQRMRDIGIAVIREVGVDTGGCNIQFAVDPDDGRIIVIEMNPRVSRSSRAGVARPPASRSPRSPPSSPSATPSTRSPTTSPRRRRRRFEPTLDYVVVKVPRFAFEKFPARRPDADHAHEEVGEAMAIGRNFTEALQKALRSLEKPRPPFAWAGATPARHGRAARRGRACPHDGRLDDGRSRRIRAGRHRRARSARGDRHRPVVPRPARC